MSEVSPKDEKSPTLLNQGGLSVLIGVAAILANLLLSALGWVNLVLGILLLLGSILMMVKSINRLLAFLLFFLGVVLILKNIFLIGIFIDVFIYLVGAIMIVVGGYGLYRYTRRNR